MNLLRWVLVCLLLLAYTPAEASLNRIVPGIIVDDHDTVSAAFITELKKELQALMPGKVRFSDRYILSSGWDFQKARDHYAFLETHQDVNLILAFGVLSSGAVIEQKTFNKPTMIVGIIDPELQGVKIPESNQSGVRNLTYILFNQSVQRDLDTFHEVFPYKKVGIIADKNMIASIVKNPDPIREIVGKSNASFCIVALEKNIQEALGRSSEFDAAFVAHMGRFEGEPKRQLISALLKKKIPSFGGMPGDIHDGALASISPEENIVRIIRRVALNIEALINGIAFSSLPLHLDFPEKLTINIQTAKQIGYSPKFSVLAKAEVVNKPTGDDEKILTLELAIREALEKNIRLNIARDDVSLAAEDARISRSGYFPAFSVNATQTVIDQDRAENSGGQQAELTASGSAKLEQVIFSDNLNTSVEVSEKAFEAAQSSYRAKYLDTVFNVAEAYFNALKAKTRAQIQKQDLKLTQKHLTIAKQRRVAGYSGLSDVYRWQSSIATATADRFGAANAFNLNKISLNRLLDRPLDSEIELKEETLEGALFKAYFESGEFEFIDNPASFAKFVDFLVARSIENSPEIKEVDANLAGLERQLINYKRRRFLPTASVTGDATHIFSRDGKGTDGPGIDPKDDQWALAMNLNWPIFSGGSIRLNQVKTQKEISRLKRQLVDLTQNLEQNVRSAAIEIVNSYINVETSRESNKYAQKSLDLVQDSYAKGKISITELVNTQSEALNARLRALTAAYDYLLAVFSLERAVGRYGIFYKDDEYQRYLDDLERFMAMESE